MELTYLTDYGLRVLMYAGAHRGRRITLRELADAYEISIEHLRKVVHRLSRCGYLHTSRGRTGGLRLAHNPEDIRIGDIVTRLEHSLAIIDCNRQPCRLCGICSLKGVLDDARDAFLQRLNQYTLADLIEEQDTHAGLRRLEPVL